MIYPLSMQYRFVILKEVRYSLFVVTLLTGLVRNYIPVYNAMTLKNTFNSPVRFSLTRWFYHHIE